MEEEKSIMQKMLRVGDCGKVKKPTHGEGLGSEMKPHHLGQDLSEMVNGYAVLLEEEKSGVLEI